MNTDPAFPVPHHSLQWGMTLRQYYAGQALNGLLARQGTSYVLGAGQVYLDNTTAAAVCYADALIKALKPQPDREPNIKP